MCSSYLNVGVNWLWNVKDWLSFDFGYRVDAPGKGETFFEYVSVDQFALLARRLAKVAAERVTHYRQLFSTVNCGGFEVEGGGVPDDLERSVDAGVALGLVGAADAAAAMLDRYISCSLARLGQCPGISPETALRPLASTRPRAPTARAPKPKSPWNG